MVKAEAVAERYIYAESVSYDAAHIHYFERWSLHILHPPVLLPSTIFD